MGQLKIRVEVFVALEVELPLGRLMVVPKAICLKRVVTGPFNTQHAVAPHGTWCPAVLQLTRRDKCPPAVDQETSAIEVDIRLGSGHRRKNAVVLIWPAKGMRTNR